MRKTLLTISLMLAITLVWCDVSIARDEDRSPPGIESKMSVADLQDCQVQACELQACQVLTYQDAELSAPVPAKDIGPPVERTETGIYFKINSPPRLKAVRTNQLYRWGEMYHPLLE